MFNEEICRKCKYLVGMWRNRGVLKVDCGRPNIMVINHGAVKVEEENAPEDCPFFLEHFVERNH